MKGVKNGLNSGPIQAQAMGSCLKFFNEPKQNRPIEKTRPFGQTKTGPFKVVRSRLHFRSSLVPKNRGLISMVRSMLRSTFRSLFIEINSVLKRKKPSLNPRAGPLKAPTPQPLTWPIEPPLDGCSTSMEYEKPLK